MAPGWWPSPPPAGLRTKTVTLFRWMVVVSLFVMLSNRQINPDGLLLVSFAATRS